MSAVNFLVPRSPTWDKLCALYLLVRHYLLPNSRVWNLKDLVTAGHVCIFFEKDDMTDVPANVVDVDVRHKYNKDGFGSATERVVHLCDLELPGLERLVTIINSNNKTGYLARQQGGLPWLIREMNNIGTDEPSETRRLQVIYLLWPAVELYFTTCEDDEEEKWVTTMANPFSMSNIREMTIADQPHREKWLACLNKAIRRVQDLYLEAWEEAERIRSKAVVFPVSMRTDGGQLRICEGHFITTDKTRVPSMYFKRYPEVMLLVNRRSNGNVAIFCRGKQDFESLYRALVVLESEDQWYLQETQHSPCLLNGSTSRARARTNLSRPKLIELIQQHFVHNPRSQRDND